MGIILSTLGLSLWLLLLRVILQLRIILRLRTVGGRWLLLLRLAILRLRTVGGRWWLLLPLLLLLLLSWLVSHFSSVKY